MALQSIFPGQTFLLNSTLLDPTDDISTWISKRYLKFNKCKTELLIFFPKPVLPAIIHLRQWQHHISKQKTLHLSLISILLSTPHPPLLGNPVEVTFKLIPQHDISHPTPLLLAWLKPIVWIVIRDSSKALYYTVTIVLRVLFILNTKVRMALLKVKPNHVTSPLKILRLHSSLLRIIVKPQVMTYRSFMN